MSACSTTSASGQFFISLDPGDAGTYRNFHIRHDSLKPDNTNGGFAWRPTRISAHISGTTSAYFVKHLPARNKTFRKYTAVVINKTYLLCLMRFLMDVLTMTDVTNQTYFITLHFKIQQQMGWFWSNEVGLLQALAKIGEVIQTSHMD